MRNLGIFALLLIWLVAACGDDDAATGDTTGGDTTDDTTDTTDTTGTGDGDSDTGTDEEPTTPPDDEAECGDARVEGDEECDDGNNDDEDACNADCTFTCGDGRLGSNENCDIGIESGEGACPSDCDDGDACTDDSVAGAECEQQCVNAPITEPVNDDGCCPDGGNANNDSDCAAVCGNGVVEEGEVCDTSIEAGLPGACPTDCDDGQVCTADVLENAGTCQATCTNTEITEPANDDGCCPAGGNSNNDNDCSASCGNGEVEDGETCDTAIEAGQPGACPTECSDGDACTRDVLVSGGTCNAACSFPDITTPANDDGCCPDGANNNNDNDCPVTCGNGVPEEGEQCDDGNTDDGDGCSAECSFEGRTYRITTLELRDPHIWLAPIVFPCQDVTTSGPFGFSVNGVISDSINGLELNLLTQLSPARQDAPGGDVSVITAECEEANGGVSCSNADPANVTSTTFTNTSSGTCLEPVPGTTSGYDPPIQPPADGCFASEAVSLTIDLAGAPIALTGAQVAAEYSGSPPRQLLGGLVTGFISEEDADDISIEIDLIGEIVLSSALRGGTDNCSAPSPEVGDRDTGPDGEPGWWFYLYFEAEEVPFTDNTSGLRADEQAALMSLP